MQLITPPTKSQSMACKLLARAMDSSAAEGEAQNAAEKFVAVVRRDRVSFPDFVRHLSESFISVREKPDVSDEPPAMSLCIHFGKYRGMTLGKIATEDVSYVGWIAANHSQPYLRNAAKIVLDFYGGERQ